MTNVQWRKCQKPEELLCALRTSLHKCSTRRRASSRRRLNLFALACCRQIWPLIRDRRSRSALAAAEREVELHPNPANSPGLQRALDKALEALPDGEFTGDPKQLARAAVSAALLMLAKETQGYRSPFDFAIQIANVTSSATGGTKSDRSVHAEIIRDIFGNPFRPVTFDSDWRTSTAVALAQQMYDSRDFSAMPILADALQDAGCDNADILDHCRGSGPHVRGCWVADLVLGKE